MAMSSGSMPRETCASPSASQSRQQGSKTRHQLFDVAQDQRRFVLVRLAFGAERVFGIDSLVHVGASRCLRSEKTIHGLDQDRERTIVEDERLEQDLVLFLRQILQRPLLDTLRSGQLALI